MTVSEGIMRFASTVKVFAFLIPSVVEEMQRISGLIVSSLFRSSFSASAKAEASTRVQSKPSLRATADRIRIPREGEVLPPPESEP